MSGHGPTVKARQRRGDRGAVIPIVALCLPILLIMTAFAVDLGRQRAARRTMQSRADVIALDMARLIDGSTEDALENSGAPATMLAQSTTRNGIDLSKVTYEWGTWNGSAFVGTLGTAVPNAVSVRAQDDVDYFFQPGTGHADRHAVATNGEPIAAVQVGSFAARFPEGEDSFIATLGEALGLDPPYAQIIGFEGLANSRVPLGDLFTELQLGSPEEVANGSVSLQDFYLATARVLSRSDAAEDTANAELLEAIAPSLPSTPVAVGELVQLEPGGGGAALDGSVNALDILTAAAILSNGTSGVSVPNLTLDNLDLGPLDLASVTASLNVIQPPQLVRGPTGTTGRTDQVSTVVNARLLGFPGFSLATIKIELNTAAASAVIGPIDCGVPERFSVEANSALLESKITITLASLVTLTITKPPGTETEHVTFTLTSSPDADPQTFNPEMHVLNDGEIGLSNATVAAQPQLLGFILNPILANLTGTVLPILDQNLLGPLSDQLGINVGGADYYPQEVDCQAGVKLVE